MSIFEDLYDGFFGLTEGEGTYIDMYEPADRVAWLQVQRPNLGRDCLYHSEAQGRFRGLGRSSGGDSFLFTISSYSGPGYIA